MPTGNKPENFDFGMSHWYREGVSGNKQPPKPTVQPRGRVVGKRNIAGITLNVTEGAPDDGSFPAIEENLVRMGIYPKKETTPAPPQSESPEPQESDTPLPPEHSDQLEQSAFFGVTPKKSKPKKTGREPGKIRPMWHADPEPFIEIGQNPDKRRKALASDAGHDSTLARQAKRRSYGLPEKAPPWKELMRDFKALTNDEREILRDMGFRPDWVTNPHSLTVERMLHALHQMRKP